MSPPPPLAALLTPRGRGAVATIAFHGDPRLIDAAPLFRAANAHPLAAQPLNRIAFGRWGDDPPEEVVACRLSPDRLELHCHGGEAAANRILADLERLGTERLPWRDFIERTEGPFAADAAEALAAATTPRTAALITRQAEGPLRDALRRLASADIETERDETLAELDRLLRHADFGLHLTHPWRVVLFGEPNVGKSSLINALVGFERAIVFDRPGTTRDVVTAETAFDGWPVRLSDTAGLRPDPETLEAAGIERAKAELAEADLRLLVLDRSRPADPPCERQMQRDFRPALTVLNKADLPDARRDAPHPEPATAVSAKTGEGIRDLIARITSALIPELPPDDEPIPIAPRQIEALNAARAALLAHDAETYHRRLAAIAP